MDQLIETFSKAPEEIHPLRFLLKPVSRQKEFFELPPEKVIRSFVKDKLYSQPVVLTNDSW